MSTLSSANVTDVNLVLKERTHMRLCINMLIFTHNLGNWLITVIFITVIHWYKLVPCWFVCVSVRWSSVGQIYCVTGWRSSTIELRHQTHRWQQLSRRESRQ